MSRIGKKPVAIPAKVTVKIDGQQVTAKGPKGERTLDVHPKITVKQEGTNLVVTRGSDEREDRALHGLTRALLNNLIVGVNDGFTKSLTVNGVGYDGKLQGKTLVLKLGYSHDVKIEPMEGITFEVRRETPIIFHISVSGADKQVVGEQAAQIRGWRPPEPYLGKGVRYSNEVIRRKAGKTGK